MDELSLEQKYVDFIEELISQVEVMLPDDVNELQKNYLIKNIKKSATLMATSIVDTEEFNILDFEGQCFYIQVIAEWSFHKEIDLFRSGIPPKYWKVVMQKIWYTMWEVMYACVKNDAPQTVVLTLVERFVNRSYEAAVEELKDYNLIDGTIEEQAKEQSNIDKMAQELRVVKKIIDGFKMFIKKLILVLVICAVVSFLIIKLKTLGIILIMSWLVAFHLIPTVKK
ncbi:MAG: hypothetical protein E7Z87_08560 [Cyanobacteria bacterium SIG26]|nr:hypothetical protein [Cyanobacteria bacterium SIG26]